MKPYFQYSILKYRPSYLLDERLNLGLLFRFVNEERQEQFYFVYPSRLGRISHSFPNLGKKNLFYIKQYLKAFERRAKELGNKQWEGLEEVIRSEFLIDDANSLFFSPVKEGFHSSVEEILDYYQKVYFKFYETGRSQKTPDSLVKEYFKQSLERLATSKDVRLDYFEKDISIPNKITVTRFEYRWQNGRSNLVKTLGFNLSDKQDIQDKAFKWTSALNYLHQSPDYKNYHFDLLLGRPKNPSLLEAYQSALEIFQDIRASKTIIEEEEIEAYAARALREVRPAGG